MPELLERWRLGPVELPQQAHVRLRAGTAVFSTRSWTERDGDPGFPRRSRAWPWSSSSERAATSPARLWRSTTAASRSPGRCSHRAVRSSSSATRAGGWRSEEDAAARAWWQEVIGALAR